MPRPVVDLVPPTPGSQRPAATVGVLVSIALAILVVGTLWLARAGGGPVYYAELPETPGLRVGAPVLNRGMSIGRVDDIVFTDTSVRVAIRLGRDDVPIRQGTAARMGRMGILGDRDLELVPSVTPSAPVLPPGSTLARAAPDDAQRAIDLLARDVIEGRSGRADSTATIPGATPRPDSTSRP